MRSRTVSAESLSSQRLSMNQVAPASASDRSLVILTWVYFGSGGSALLTGLTHAALNGFTPLSRGIDEVQGWELHGIAVAVVALVLVVLSSSLRQPVLDTLPDLSSPRISELPQSSQ